MSENSYANPYSVDSAAVSMMKSDPGHDIGNALVAGSEARVMAEVKAQVFMARQYPRNPGLSMSRILEECKRPTLAEKAHYTYARGKETVSGPSIRLAEVIARGWGNITFGYDVLDRSGGRSVVSAYAWDLETNIRSSIQFEVKHWRTTRSGGYALTEDRDIYELEANMAARRRRACMLALIPGDVVDAASEACEATLSNGIVQAMADPKRRDSTISKFIKAFAGFGAVQKDLEDHLNVPMDKWTADHVVKLQQIGNTLKDGAAPVGDFFPRLAQLGGNATITKEQTDELMSVAASIGKQGDFSRYLKELGISKVADIPADKYEECKKHLESLVNKVLDEEAAASSQS